jgi:hypothetical protein
LKPVEVGCFRGYKIIYTLGSNQAATVLHSGEHKSNVSEIARQLGKLRDLAKSKAKAKAKAKAARENGKLGGRPKKRSKSRRKLPKHS